MAALTYDSPCHCERQFHLSIADSSRGAGQPFEFFGGLAGKRGAPGSSFPCTSCSMMLAVAAKNGQRTQSRPRGLAKGAFLTPGTAQHHFTATAWLALPGRRLPSTTQCTSEGWRCRPFRGNAAPGMTSPGKEGVVCPGLILYSCAVHCLLQAGAVCIWKLDV